MLGVKEKLHVEAVGSPVETSVLESTDTKNNRHIMVEQYITIMSYSKQSDCKMV